MPDRYWRTDGQLHNGSPGLKIFEPQDVDVADERGRIVDVIRAPTNFQQYTQACLNLLYRTTAGQTVLQTLATSTSSIAYSTEANTAGVGNAQASMNQVAYEILKAPGRPGAAAQTAMRQGFGVQNVVLNTPNTLETGRRLAAVINAQPRWKLNEIPGSGGSYLTAAREYANRWLLWSKDSSEGYFDNKRWFATGGSAAGLNLTAQETLDWIRLGRAPTRLGTADQEQLKLATVVALEPHSARGAGSPSSVRFVIGDRDPYRKLRPPAVALGHELIHAYFSHRGEQPGEELDHFSTVLFEFKCVGLGPWNENATSENALRAQWSGVVAHVADDDPHNKVKPGKRVRY